MSRPPREVWFTADDGLELSGLLQKPETVAVRSALLVPGSRHERDSFATLAEALANEGIASLRTDLRGRGTNVGDTRFSDMGPLQRRQVRGDAEAAARLLAFEAACPIASSAIVAEQDTAADATLGALDGGAGAVVVLSARTMKRALHPIERADVPLLGIVSIEDRQGVRHTVDSYLSASVRGSRLDLLQSRGIGATMFHTGARTESSTPLETLIAEWLVSALPPAPRP